MPSPLILTIENLMRDHCWYSVLEVPEGFATCRVLSKWSHSQGHCHSEIVVCLEGCSQNWSLQTSVYSEVKMINLWFKRALV